MAFLQDFFEYLSYGELSNTSTGNRFTGDITPEMYPKVVSALNLGLRDLYTRLDIKKSDKTIQQITGTNEYDIGEPDLVKVLWIKDQDKNTLMMNDMAYPDELFLPDIQTIQVNDVLAPRTLIVTYQSIHPRIVIQEEFNPETYEVTFPFFTYPALLNYIASKLSSGKVVRKDETENIAATFRYQYEREIKKIVADGHIMAFTDSGIKHTNQGWV